MAETKVNENKDVKKDPFAEEDRSPFSLKVWAKMLPYLKPTMKWFLICIALMLGSAAIDVLYPIINKYAVDNFIEMGTLEGLLPYTIGYIAIMMVQVVFVVGFSRLSMTVEMDVGRRLKEKCFVHLQSLSFSYYNLTPVGWIMARVLSDTNRIGGVIAWGVVDICWSGFYVIGVFISMFILNWKLAILVVTVVPAIAIITALFQGRILSLNRRIRRINSAITGAFNEGITGARTSKTLVIEERNSRDFEDLTAEMKRTTLKSTKLNAIFIPLIVFCGSMASAFVLVRGGYMNMEGLLQIGTLSAFVSYATGIFEPIQQIARILADMVATQANIERVNTLLETEPDITDTPEVIERYGDSFEPKRENWEPIEGEIEFKDVWFKYPDGGDYVLEDFNLKIPAGTTVAIVGETGAGKSTLVNLACRFFEPTQGQVLIDGRDYKERSQLWLHQSIGYVLQDPHLFSGTVYENIRYGRLEATDEEVREAARLVAADKVVVKLDGGYDSDVGEGGDRLSTGEKQLISFARAVLADPRIFVLDEATSSIDTETEQLIQDAISYLLEGRTSFLIAHRLSTIKQADLILVVRDGKIIEQGTHKELLKQRGYYYSLYIKQFEEEISQSI